MQKLLTTLWVIIIAGSAYIVIELSRPEEIIEKTPLVTNEKPTTNPEEILPELTEPETSSLPLTYSEYLEKGKNFQQENNYKSAIENFTNAAKLNPNSIEPLIYLAEAYLLDNSPSEAKDVFLKASEIDPTSLQVSLGIARAYLDLRDFENAKEIIWALPKEDPSIKYYTAIILILHKDFEGAKKLFQEIIADKTISDEDLKIKTTNFLNAYENFSYFKEGQTLHLQTLLAKAFTENGLYNASIPLTYDIITEQNNYRDAWIILGYAYLNIEKNTDAIDALKKAKDLSPEKPETLFFLGLAYSANSETDNAIFYLEQAKRYGYEPQDQIELRLGDLYLLKENYEKAAQKFENLIAKNIINLDIYVKAVWLNIDKLGNNQKALELATASLEKYPENAMSYNLVGWSLLASNNLEEAKVYLLKSLELNPNLDSANLNLGTLYEKENEKELAKEYYKKAYYLGNGSSISRLAASKFKKLNLTSPSL